MLISLWKCVQAIQASTRGASGLDPFGEVECLAEGNWGGTSKHYQSLFE